MSKELPSTSITVDGSGTAGTTAAEMRTSMSL
jgi:hypothetical protein